MNGGLFRNTEMKKHKFKEVEIETSFGERGIAYICEDCGASEGEGKKCMVLITETGDYLEKALKAVARL